MKPKRIQRQRTKGWRMPPNTVYVGRPSKWGNPFVANLTMGQGGKLLNKQEVVAWFEKWMTSPILQSEFRIKIKDVKRELKGKNLACWCKTYELCHADILLEIANG